MKSVTNWVSKVQEILEKLHPNNWDMKEVTEDDVMNDSNYVFYVKYPIINISNSKGLTHIIKDFYLKLEFASNGNLQKHLLEGTRGILSQAEKQSSYAYSHISSTATTGNWGGFCWGDGPIGVDAYELQVKGFDEIKFEMFIYAFSTYLEWESIEGGPYAKIENIRKRIGIRIIQNRYLQDYFKQFISKYDKVNFTISTSPARIMIDYLDSDFIDQVISLIKDENNLVYRTTDGEFFIQGSNINYDDLDIGFEFKGESIKQKVINDETEQGNKKYPHPDILKYIGERLARKLTLYSFNEGERIKRKSKGSLIAGVMVQAL